MRVYVAGPLEGGNQRANVRQAIQAMSDLLAAGHEPFCQHLSWFADLVGERPYEDWMRLDMAWLEVAEIFLRLPGVSPGADREEKRARELGIPVVGSVAQLLAATA